MVFGVLLIILCEYYLNLLVKSYNYVFCSLFLNFYHLLSLSHSLSHTLSIYLPLSLSNTHTHPLSHSISLSISFSLSLSPSISFSLFLPVFFILTFSLFPSSSHIILLTKVKVLSLLQQVITWREEMERPWVKYSVF